MNRMMTPKPALFDGQISRQELHQRCRLLAGLDVVLAGGDDRQYFFQAGPQCDVFRFRDRPGRELLGLFGPEGVVLKGFDDESPLSCYARALVQPRAGIYDAMPEALRRRLRSDRDLRWEEVTFCFWRGRRDSHWWEGVVDKRRDEDDGSRHLLARLHRDADSYRRHFARRSGRDLDSNVLAAVFQRGRIRREHIRALDPAGKPARLVPALRKLGFEFEASGAAGA